MATDARFACPICSEPYDAAPAECFRCETPLGSWWRFEEAAARTAPVRQERWSIVPIVFAAALGALAATIALWAPARVAPVRRPASVSVGAAPAAPTAPVAPDHSHDTRVGAPPVPAIAYRVQPGDSLWRIAAALTGDGRNWKTLWPTMDPARPLAVGTVLELDPSRAAAPAR